MAMESQKIKGFSIQLCIVVSSKFMINFWDFGKYALKNMVVKPHEMQNE